MTGLLSPRVWSGFVRTMAARQSTLLANAGALTAGNLANAFIGFFYWWFAARNFSPREVGLAAAAVSIMSLLAQIGEFGMGPLLISELPRSGKMAGPLVSAAIAAAMISILGVGLCFLGISHLFAFDLGHVTDTVASSGFFLFGVALTTFVVVLDQAFVGLLRSYLQMYRSITFSIIKLVLLVVAAFALARGGRELVIFATWVLGQLGSLILLATINGRSRKGVYHAPNLTILRPLVRNILGHHALNVALQAPALILPFIVTVALSAQTNAAFYAAWTLVNVILLVPASLSVVLVTSVRQDPGQLGRRLGLSLAVSAGVAVCAGVGCLFGSSFILGLFSPNYPAIAGNSLALLGFGTVGVMLKYHYISIQRLAGRLLSGTLLMMAGGTLEIVASVAGVRGGGLDGLTEYWLLTVTLEGLIVLPTLLSALSPSSERTPHELKRWLRKAAGPLSWPSKLRASSQAPLLALLVVAASTLSAGAAQSISPRPGFVSASGTHFVVDGRPLRVAGVNNHYLAYGSREEVIRVLDDAVAMHANVVRTILQPVIGSTDGAKPTIWDWKSDHDSSNLGARGHWMLSWDTARDAMAINEGPEGLAQLDFVLAEANARHLYLIISLLDFWGYMGGAEQMSAWYGSQDKYTFFARDSRTRANYRQWVESVISRTNKTNGVPYRDDPTIFAWELMNEPDIQPFSLLINWLTEMSTFVKALDPSHLVATGHGNMVNKLRDLDIPAVDFGTWHAYPAWEKITPEQLNGLIGEYCALGADRNKPVLLEEFGLASSDPAQLAAYQMWTGAIQRNRDCAGWLVWRLVSLQDSGRYPEDFDRFDIRNDGGVLWHALIAMADRTRSGSFALPGG